MAKTVSLTLPLTRADLADLEVGDEVLLSGPVYTMRDAGHERALQCLEDTGRLPFDLEGATLFYAGPTPAAAGRPLGSVGPTTASRMDFATPRLFEAGIVAAIGKGKRSPEVVRSCQETGRRWPPSRGRTDTTDTLSAPRGAGDHAGGVASEPPFPSAARAALSPGTEPSREGGRVVAGVGAVEQGVAHERHAQAAVRVGSGPPRSRG